MGQYQQLNQFQQAPIKGDTATKVNLNTLSVQIDPNSSNTLLPGDAVYMTSTDGNTILVDKCSATVAPFGYVLYSIKYDQFVAGDAVEIGLFGQIMYGEADGNIVRGNNLEYVPSASLTVGPRMLVSGGVNPISGLALDNAGDSDIFRFMVLGVTYPVTATISGGFINNTPIGQATAAAGSFTTLTSLQATDTISVLSVSGTTAALNPALGGMFTLTPAASVTINVSSVPVGHQRVVVQLLTSGTTPYQITFGTNMKSTATINTGAVSGKYWNIVFDSNGVNFVESSRTVAI